MQILLYFKYNIKVKSYLQILSINIIPTVPILIIRGHLENGSVAHPCMIIVIIIIIIFTIISICINVLQIHFLDNFSLF